MTDQISPGELPNWNNALWSRRKARQRRMSREPCSNYYDTDAVFVCQQENLPEHKDDLRSIENTAPANGLLEPVKLEKSALWVHKSIVFVIHFGYIA